MIEKQKKSRLNPTRTALLFWCLFVGIGAVVGALCMLIRPDGSLLQMQNMLLYFKKLPLADILYQNYGNTAQKKMPDTAEYDIINLWINK